MVEAGKWLLLSFPEIKTVHHKKPEILSVNVQVQKLKKSNSKTGLKFVCLSDTFEPINEH